MDHLRRFLTQTERQNREQLHLSEMRKKQIYMIQHDSIRGMLRDRKLA